MELDVVVRLPENVRSVPPDHLVIRCWVLDPSAMCVKAAKLAFTVLDVLEEMLASASSADPAPTSRWRELTRAPVAVVKPVPQVWFAKAVLVTALEPV
jgi:hypothetical protein